jgi:hypothetical protein
MNELGINIYAGVGPSRMKFCNGGRLERTSILAAEVEWSSQRILNSKLDDSHLGAEPASTEKGYMDSLAL